MSAKSARGKRNYGTREQHGELISTGYREDTEKQCFGDDCADDLAKPVTAVANAVVPPGEVEIMVGSSLGLPRLTIAVKANPNTSRAQHGTRLKAIYPTLKNEAYLDVISETVPRFEASRRLVCCAPFHELHRHHCDSWAALEADNTESSQSTRLIRPKQKFEARRDVS